MQTLTNMFKPITSAPFQSDEAYCEILPCDALKPYIRCFWGTDRPINVNPDEESFSLVIPDTCMDILFRTDYTNNTSVEYFCNLDLNSFWSSGLKNTVLTSTFGIRFYGWSAILFTDYNFKDDKFFTASDFSAQLKRELEPILFDTVTLADKIRIAEKFLLERLNKSRINNDFLNSIYYIIKNHANVRITDVCSYTGVSERKLQRIFEYNMGISPKAFSSITRYQMLWKDILFSPNYNVLDAVDKYGYTDQSHLLNDFKSRHLMTVKDAVNYALSDFYNTKTL